jgi:hypothetical protein
MKEIDLPGQTHRPADGRLVQELRSEMQAAMHDHRAVMLGNSHHDYSIVAFNPGADEVTIHNPYNRSGFEGFADGTKVTRTDGFFTLKTEEMAKYFNYLYFEAKRA